MRYRIIERNCGGFIVEWRPHMLSAWRSISDESEIYNATMRGYFGPVRSKIFSNIAAAKEAIKTHKHKSVVKNSHIVWEE